MKQATGRTRGRLLAGLAVAALVGPLLGLSHAAATPATDGGPTLPTTATTEPPLTIPDLPPVGVDLAIVDVTFGVAPAGRYFLDVTIRNEGGTGSGTALVWESVAWRTEEIGAIAPGGERVVRFFRWSCEAAGTIEVWSNGWWHDVWSANNTREWIKIC